MHRLNESTHNSHKQNILRRAFEVMISDGLVRTSDYRNARRRRGARHVTFRDLEAHSPRPSSIVLTKRRSSKSGSLPLSPIDSAQLIRGSAK
jgi:hypothetical protein